MTNLIFPLLTFIFNIIGIIPPGYQNYPAFRAPGVILNFIL